MPRKARNPGVYPRVSKLTGRTVYDAVVSVDRRQKTKRGFLNPTAAKSWQDDTRADMRRNGYASAPATMTLEDLIVDRWLPGKLADCKSARSRETYSYWAQRICCDIGGLRLRTLSKLDVSAWRTWLVSTSADATARGVFSCFVSAIRWAVDHELIAKDVTLATKRPTAEPRNPPVQSVGDVKRLLELAEQQERPVGLMVWLGAMLGLRFGECVTLTWEQVDLGDATVRLNRMALRQVTPDGRIKTDAGERLIGLTADQVEKLREYRLQQIAAYRELGAPPPRLVLLRDDGHPVKAPWFWWRFNAVREAMGLPWLHFHDLRHVNATMLARAGVHPKVASVRLGHSNDAITMRVYTHVNAQQQIEAAEALERLFGNAKS